MKKSNDVCLPERQRRISRALLKLVFIAIAPTLWLRSFIPLRSIQDDKQHIKLPLRGSEGYVNYQKSLAEFRPKGRNRIQSIFSGSMYHGKNTAQTASVREKRVRGAGCKLIAAGRSALAETSARMFRRSLYFLFLMYSSIAAADFLPAPIARITVAAPVTTSPPANTFSREV